MVTETDRNKARSAVVSAYHDLDCVTIPFSFLHAFADAAVDAVSTDAEQAIMDDEDRTPMPAGFDDALWRKADEVDHAMALVARDQECVKIIYAALSTHNAEPVKTAPAVALTRLAIRTGGSGANVYAFTEADDDGDYVFYTEAKSALAAQVQDVAGLELRPHEPTKKMLDAAMKADQDGMSASMKTIWMVMWAAYSASPASKHGDAE